MTAPVRLHLVEPQPLLRGRLAVAFEQLGFTVSYGEPTASVPDGAFLLVNIDGPDDDWAIGAELLIQDHGTRAVVTSSSAARLGDEAWSGAFAKQLRPFVPAALRFPDGLPADGSFGSPAPPVSPEPAGGEASARGGVTSLPTERELPAVEASLESVLVDSYAEAIAALVPLWSSLNERERTSEVRQMLERLVAELRAS